MVLLAADKAPPACAKILKALAPFAGMIQAFWIAAWPYLCKLAGLLYKLYNLVPTDLFHAAHGFVLCFAGGLYPTLFAAIEAARLCGWDRTSKAIDSLWAQAALLDAANQKDDKVDDVGDGKSDVASLSAKDLLLRKTQLTLTTMDPGVINEAFSGLYISWLAVFATLKVQFAATVALALSIADAFKNPCKWWVEPACF